MSVHWPILRNLLLHPTKEFVADDFRRYKGYELLIASLNARAHIEKATSAKHVGIMLPTSGLFPIAALGAWSAGRVVVPLNYLLMKDELAYVIADSEIDTIITAGPMLDHLGYEPEGVKLVKMDELNFKKLPPVSIPKKAKPEDLATIVYTSGTSGKPKGVMLSHGAVAANARQGGEHMGVKKTDRFLGVLPQFHCYGLTQLTITPLTFGVPVTYVARFMPKRLVDRIHEEKATVMVAIPSMLNAIAALKSGKPEQLASLRLIVSGSEKLPRAVFDKFREKFDKPIREGYGMTEMSPATHCCIEGDERLGSVGHPLPGVEQYIAVPGSDEKAPPGEPGEIRLKGPNLMTGYFKLPEETDAVFCPGGYYKTGDQGVIDEDGYLSITGRIKEMMIVGGENVFPREIEEVVDAHPDVHASGVIGMEDKTRGEVPVVFVELEEGHELDERSIIALCREKLAGYKVPKKVIRLDELPRNPTGKIMRRKLKPYLERDEALESPAS
ncbi:MAG: AMP-binding protein [Planctomycetota bacterium]